jgi:predicted transposase YdaD
LLLDTVQTYLTLENERLAEYHLLLGAEPKKEVAAVELWWSQKLEQKGLQEGKQEGLQEGLQKGLQKGKVNAMAVALFLCLEKRGLTPTDEQKQRIEACGDFETLQAWFSLAFEISAVDELFSSSRT